MRQKSLFNKQRYSLHQLETLLAKGGRRVGPKRWKALWKEYIRMAQAAELADSPEHWTPQERWKEWL
jgi:hypothetical protein